ELSWRRRFSASSPAPAIQDGARPEFSTWEETMAKTFRMTWTTQLFNSIVTGLLRLGAPVGSMALLTVSGRETGEPRATPSATLEYEGKDFVIAPYGAVNWVRNLRAAGQATLTRRGRTDEIVAVELSPKDAAPVLQLAIGRMPAFLRQYFEV